MKQCYIKEFVYEYVMTGIHTHRHTHTGDLVPKSRRTGREERTLGTRYSRGVRIEAGRSLSIP